MQYKNRFKCFNFKRRGFVKQGENQCQMFVNWGKNGYQEVDVQRL